ncbi:MAG: DUF5989 family protein [Planctomycetaceae bacterium]
MAAQIPPDSHKRDRQTEFEAAGEEPQPSLAAEFFLFLKEEKKWWLTPIILVLLATGVIVALTATGAAPFIYALF